MRTYSLSQAAQILGCARETIRRRLAEAGLKPAGTYRGNARYTLRDICVAWFVPPQTDPDELQPFDRRAHYQAELAKRQVEVSRAELVDSGDFVESQRRLSASMIAALRTLRDELAQDPAMAKVVRSHLNRTIAQLRKFLEDNRDER